MATLRLIFCVAVFLVILSENRLWTYAQRCQLPTFNDVDVSLDEGLDIIFLDDVDVTLLGYNLTCLSVGTRRDTYRLASVIVVFVVTNVNVRDDCLINQECRGFFNLECDDRDNTWGVPIFNPLRIDVSLSLNVSEPRLDCGSCNDGNAIPCSDTDPDCFDEATNCFSKSES